MLAGLSPLLQRIVTARREQAEAARATLPLAELKARVADLPPLPRARFSSALLAGSSPGEGRLAVIAELKRSSPSAGAIRPQLDVREMARTYAGAGASALSVLAERSHFGGSPEDLRMVRGAVGLPLLAKDFLVEPYTIYEARLSGADAVLLITRLLSPGELADFLGLAAELGMDALVEVHSETELERALATPARLIGINNRNLETLAVDLHTVRRLAGLIPPDRIVVAESGYTRPADVADLPALGVRAVLVGEAALRSADPAAFIRSLATPRTMVKICGLQDEESVETVAAAGADAAGLVFYRASRRFVPPERARSLVKVWRRSTRFRPLPPVAAATVPAARGAAVLPLVVGVFVDSPPDEVVRVAAELELDAVQLHGNEDIRFLDTLRSGLSRLNLPTRILLARSYAQVGEALADETPAALARQGLIDAWLVDRRGSLPGGNGVPLTSTWTELAGLSEARRSGRLPVPWGLAGGLTPDNVAAACRQAWPDFVDVSSGVEREGRKSPELVRAFVTAVRSAWLVATAPGCPPAEPDSASLKAASNEKE
ncbi:MAG TPA: indole-3-glycerol phosphate synthase TrpC [Firmicutes bacterium]|nr:indole-3-glycerol phosphate synthase TrpC [Bacillota bacterium]